MMQSLREHWPEYLIEAAGLGLFMLSASVFATLLESPASPVHQAIADDLTRRGLMGVAMGLTTVGLIYSPWGQRSGAHFNPAVTLTFFRLGKVLPWDAVFYVTAQFLGGIGGVLVALVLLGEPFANSPVNYVITAPVDGRIAIAFLAESAISFGLMLTVLITANNSRLSRWTGLCAGGLIAFYIIVEAPLSGMSMNPARTLASALPAHFYTDVWIYFTAPFFGMLTAAMMYQFIKHGQEVACAKLHHHKDKRCIFRNCRYEEMMKSN